MLQLLSKEELKSDFTKSRDIYGGPPAAGALDFLTIGRKVCLAKVPDRLELEKRNRTNVRLCGATQFQSIVIRQRLCWRG